MSSPREHRGFAVIPTGYDPGSYTCVRSLSRRDVGTVIASEQPNVPVGASRFCDRFVDVPSPYHDVVAYKDALVELARRPAVRTLTPMRPHDAYVFATYAADFEPHVSLVTPPTETLDVVHDRMQLYEAALDAGVPVPETRCLEDARDWHSDVVVKARYNLLSHDRVPAFDPHHVETVKCVEHVPAGGDLDVAGLCERMRHVPIVQEYVDHDGEYVFAALYEHGEPLATFQHHQIRGDSYTGGGGVYRESIYDPDLERVGRQLLDSLEYHGLACIEYARDRETGEYYLVEVNPRFWQSLPCAVRSGADFPYYYWLATTGRSDEIEPDYRVGVGTHMLYGELGYLRSILTDESPFRERPSLWRETLAVVASCLTSANFDDLHLDDPAPFVRGLRHVVSK